MNYSILEDGHISSPQGFRATGVAAGLRENKSRDLALVYSVRPCQAAAMFTTSTLPAAPVVFDRAILARNRDAIRAVLINSGHANAGTGQPGLTDAVECAKLLADELEVPRDAVLLLSTGLIGAALPMRLIRSGIKRAVSELDSGGGRRAATAILTTDKRPKERALRLDFGAGRTALLAGMIKGHRSVFPRLATLLCVITSDVAIQRDLLNHSLQQSVGRTLACVTTDRDSTPNDAVLLLANGASAAPMIEDPADPAFGIWQAALDALLADLGQQLLYEAADDGKLLIVTVRGALADTQAHQLALAVAHSPAVRAACAAATADWGPLLAAIGGAGIPLRPELLELALGDVTVMRDGRPYAYDAVAAQQALHGREVSLAIDLHLGPATATVWSCTSFS
jgi:glutamate N-acetyltransferase / amino-acid N-acetyltransferase